MINSDQNVSGIFPYPMPMPVAMAMLTMFSLGIVDGVGFCCDCFRFIGICVKNKMPPKLLMPQGNFTVFDNGDNGNPQSNRNGVYHHDAFQLDGPARMDLNCV